MEFCVNCSESADDFQTVEYESFDNYNKAAAAARRRSMIYAAVDIEGATVTDETLYCILWRERYEHGVKQWRVNV